MAERTTYRVEGKIVRFDKARTFQGDALESGIDLTIDTEEPGKKAASFIVTNVDYDAALQLYLKKGTVEIIGPLDFRENKEGTRIYVGPGKGSVKLLTEPPKK